MTSLRQLPLILALLALGGCATSQQLADRAPSAPLSVLEIPSDALRFYVGRYRLDAETGLTIERQGDRLFLAEFGGRAHELHFLGDGQYQCDGMPAPITFTTESTQSDGWSHTSATLHYVDDEGDRQSLERLPGDELTPREVLLIEGYEEALSAYRKLAIELPDDDSLSQRWLIEAGLKMASAENFEPAIDLLRIATELYPDTADTWHSVGCVYRRMGWAHTARAWYHRALEVDPDCPGALKAMAELEAERTAVRDSISTRASAWRLGLSIGLWVDGTSLVKVRGETIWIEHISGARPGVRSTRAHHTESAPIMVNGAEWSPVWNGRVSQAHTVAGGVWPVGVWFVAINTLSARGRVVTVGQASEENDYTFTLMLDDAQHSGPGWYEVELRW